MKKNVFLAVLTLLAAASCQKNMPEEKATEEPTGLLNIQLGGEPATKAASMSEHQINSAQVFVFTNDGELETDLYQTFQNGTVPPFSITTSIGEKRVYAIVNAPRLIHTSLSALEKDLSHLSDNTCSPANLVMSGKATTNVREYSAQAGTPTPCTIRVKKLASAIRLVSVATQFNGTALEGSTLRIKEIYVKNVMGRAPYGVNDDGTFLPVTDAELRNPDYWYNKTVLDSEPLYVTYDRCDLGPVTETPFQVNRTLYVYPNPTATDPKPDSTSPFDPRPTRLVLHAVVSRDASHFAGALNRDSYYTFDLPKLESNKKYTVTLVISMLGKKDDKDDTKTSPGLLQPTITVSDWDDVIGLEYKY